ncbi:hypothetical protein [Arthrobacter sp. MP_2.3]|uniref:hypothetical protein n=1 Tax=Arthrobacter sp. MP_2.3 TaxID=3349633 RepID=UPI0038D3CE6D
MRLLKRLLLALHQRRGRHLDSCGECLLQQRRERQYLERLRRADVPAASGDLTARLLARTEELARAGEPGRPGELTGAPQPGAAPRGAAHVLPPALRASVVTAAGAVAAAALLGGSAYLIGATPAPFPAAAGAADSALLPGEPPDSPADAVEAGPGAPAGWSLTGEPDFTPSGSLTGQQLIALRSAGWTCPELRELGYHLVWARSRMMAGGDLLELRLTDGQHFATVFEQHGGTKPNHPPEQNSGQPAPLNVLTGHPAPADGFSAVPVTAGNGAPVPAAGSLWVHAAAPFAAIYQTDGTTFTYMSDLPPEQADDGVAALIRARTAAPGTAGNAGQGPEGAAGGTGGSDRGGAGPAPDFTARLERGLGRIVEMLAP